MSGKDRIMPDFLGRRYRFHYLTAINLLESMGVPLGDIRVRAAGEYENYRGEIRSQDPAPGTAIPPGSIVTLNVGCFSAVDFMPYQFFYGLQGIRESDNTWETAARSVMAPFDAATIRYAAAMRMQALRYDFGITDGGHIRRFMELFEYSPGDEAQRAGKIVFLAAILPSLHLWGGNPSAVTVVLKRLFGYDVRLKENQKASTPIPEDIRYRLGSKADAARVRNGDREVVRGVRQQVRGGIRRRSARRDPRPPARGADAAQDRGIPRLLHAGRHRPHDRHQGRKAGGPDRQGEVSRVFDVPVTGGRPWSLNDAVR